uniref:Uncharacterized protein n=1 Tax=Kalanchoe fedtschenkoi TaxID=63787 RepID=A0A7N0TKH0_KALFE
MADLFHNQAQQYAQARPTYPLPTVPLPLHLLQNPLPPTRLGRRRRQRPSHQIHRRPLRQRHRHRHQRQADPVRPIPPQRRLPPHASLLPRLRSAHPRRPSLHPRPRHRRPGPPLVRPPQLLRPRQRRSQKAPRRHRRLVLHHSPHRRARRSRLRRILQGPLGALLGPAAEARRRSVRQLDLSVRGGGRV